MTTQAKHTPTPWKARLGTYDFTGPQNGRPIMDSTGEKRICDVDPKARQKKNDYKCPDPERDANTAFIVKAVNSHEALVEACKEALETCLAYNRLTGKTGVRPRQDTITKIAEALKQAEET